jgi:hypothetical protein
LQSRQDLFWATIILSIAILTKDLYLKKPDSQYEIKISSLYIIFFMLTALNLFLLRLEESFTWRQCKNEQIANSFLLSAKGQIGVVNRATWPIADCDWLWADPGTIYLLDSREFPIIIPDGAITAEQRSQWPHPPEVDLNSREVKIFGLNIPQSNQIKIK